MPVGSLWGLSYLCYLRREDLDTAGGSVPLAGDTELTSLLFWAITLNCELKQTLSLLSCFCQGILSQQPDRKLRRDQRVMDLCGLEKFKIMTKGISECEN